MRWLVLASSVTSKNGYGILCQAIAEALGRSGEIELDILTGDDKRGWRPGRNRLKSELVSSRPRLWRLFVAFDRLLIRLFARGRYDGVLVLVEHYAAAAAHFARSRRIPYVVALCGTYAVRLPLDHALYRSAFKEADRLLPISRYTRRRLEEEGVEGRYQVIPLGVDTRVFHPVSVPRRREVVFVGNFKARKGLDFLLEALVLAQKEVPDVRLKIVGRVDRKSVKFQEFAQRVEALGLAVEFTGMVTDEQLVEAYAGARLNALPSKSERFFFEGFGLVHLEANACGTLTVGTLDSGNEDAVREGCGYLIKHGDVEALSKVIVEAMTVEPYPALPRDLRTWDEVARDYLEALAGRD
jgi:glycosyltransferase involved in cell wall biosynthesis